MRFHLSTAFLLMVTADIFVWFNVAWKGFPISTLGFPQPHSDLPIYLANAFLFILMVVPLIIIFEVSYYILKPSRKSNAD